MKSILAAKHRPALAQAAGSRTLLAFDFDGTLAPLVAHPAAAVMRARTARLLAALAGRYPCLIVSGRSKRDVTRRLGGARVIEVVGNHGADVGTTRRQAAAIVARARRQLTSPVAAVTGAWMEDKTYSLSLHYRDAPEPLRARALLRRAAARLAGVRVFDGKFVVNIVAAMSPHKGDAVERTRKRLDCDTIIYVGDDRTDEDVFRAVPRTRLLGIRVGCSPNTRADYCVATQRDVDDLLAALVKLRPDSPGARTTGSHEFSI
jgi:trehalose 6-phosphate phosphatase